VQRAFVASTGSDSNACTPASPCRSFARALDVVDAGGEIVALDAAGYGPVTITKSAALIGNPGSYAGIAAGTGNAVTIATAGVDVVLGNLNLNGIGAAHGIVMTNGASLAIENCVISNFAGTAVLVSSGGAAKVVNTRVRGNGSSGFDFAPDAGRSLDIDITGSKIMGNGYVGVWGEGDGTLVVSIDDTVSSRNTFGFASTSGTMVITDSTGSNNTQSGFTAQFGGSLSVGSSMATGNLVGFDNATSTFESIGNNIVRGNTTNTSVTITALSGT
jgi:hypothetical protein